MKYSRGFTLLEVVITLFIFLVMFLALINFFVSTNSTFRYDKGFVDTASGAERVRTAVGTITLPADHVLVSHAFIIGTYTSTSTALVVEMPSIDSSGNILTGLYDYAVIYTDGTSVYERMEASGNSARTTGTKQLTDSLNSLTFTYDSSDMAAVTKVTVDVQTQTIAKDAPITAHLTQQFRLRNAP